MRFYTSIILFLLLSVGMTLNSVAMEAENFKRYTSNGQVSDAGEKNPIQGRNRRL